MSATAVLSSGQRLFADSITFQVDVSRTYRNKDGYKAGGFKLNTSFKTETHTAESFIDDVIRQGWPYTMVHLKRSPEETGAAARGVVTPKHIENFVSSQLLTGDDDSKTPGVIDWWWRDPFFSRYGLLFAESVNSIPGEAEKGHPTLLFDRSITDPALYKECLQALCYAYPRLDPLTNIDRVIYNAQGARVHILGNVCPFVVFEREILTPRREAEAEKLAVIEAERARRLAAHNGNGHAKSSNHLHAYLAGYTRWLFEKVASKRKGDNRNIAIYWAGRSIAGIEATPWARPYLDALGDVDGRIVDAAAVNGYLVEYAHNDPAEVLRIFERGRAAGGEPLDEPEARPMPVTLSSGANGASPKTAVDLPTIVTNSRHVREVSEDAYAALLTANDPPQVYRFGNVLARVISPDGRASVQPLDAAILRHFLERAAYFVALRAGEGGPVQRPSRAPDWLVSDILAYPEWPGIPELAGVVAAPVVTPCGRVHATPGYDVETGLVYRPVNALGVGDTSPARLDWAKNLILNELLGEFPFADHASRAHAVALLLLPLARPLIDGVTPLHVVTAPKEGTGKGLLSDVITRPATPDGPHLMTAGQDEDEWRKRITAALVSGTSHIMVDNVKNALVSGSLAAVLTARQWSDRVLGKTQTVTVPNRAIWLATGNNVMADSELARRCVWIRLDSNVERPWERAGFRHPNLREWADENRADLVTAALVIIQNWIAQGRPAGTAVLGSFENWARVMGGILDAAGIAGFMANAMAFYETADPAAGMWTGFIERWWEKFEGREVGTADLFPLADSSPEDNDTMTGDGLLDDLLGSGKARARKTRLGMLLGQRKDQVIGKWKLTAAGTRQRAQMYRLLKVG